MKSLLILIRKDVVLDFRQKYPILSIALYIASTIFVAYISFRGIVSPLTWNALLWLILLFTSVTICARSFIQEEDRSLYYFFVTPAFATLTAKFLYQIFLQLILLAIIIVTFSILMGNPIGNKYLYYLNFLIGSVGMSTAFTMISAIATRASNQSTMMAILGFPVILPILILGVVNAKNIVNGAELRDIQPNLLALLSVIVIIIAVSFVLFPYSRRN